MPDAGDQWSVFNCIKDGDGVHVVPTGSPADREHLLDATCWCEPSVDFTADNGNIVWMHRIPDGQGGYVMNERRE